MLRNFWFPIALVFAGVAMSALAGLTTDNARRVWLSIAVLAWALAALSYIWGDPVRGPFAGLRHPNESDTARLHAGITYVFPVRQLAVGIDFSKVMMIPGNPIELEVSRTWWSGWRYRITLRTALKVIEIDNRKKMISGVDGGLDYNADDHAVEIVDAAQRPIFQLIQDGDLDIYLNAVLADGQLFTVLNGNTLSIRIPEDKTERSRPKRVFKYPAYANRGKRA